MQLHGSFVEIMMLLTVIYIDLFSIWRQTFIVVQDSTVELFALGRKKMTPSIVHTLSTLSLAFVCSPNPSFPWGLVLHGCSYQSKTKTAGDRDNRQKCYSFVIAELKID